MAQPFPAHTSVPVEELRAIADMAARLYTRAGLLLEESGHGLADDLAPTVFEENVYTLDDYRERRQGVSR